MKMLTRFAFVASLCTALIAGSAFAEGPRQEAAEHPRIAKAIHEMEDALKYMEAAPHDFGGHKADAIDATKKAIEQLRLALAYRAVKDTAKGK